MASEDDVPVAESALAPPPAPVAAVPTTVVSSGEMRYPVPAGLGRPGSMVTVGDKTYEVANDMTITVGPLVAEADVKKAFGQK